MMKIDSERLVGLINDDIKKIEHKLGDGSSSAYFYLNLSNPELMSYNKGALKEAYYIIGLIEALAEKKNE